MLIDTYFIRAVARQGRDSLIAQKRNLGDCVDESARLDPLAHDATPRKIESKEKKSLGTQCDSCAKIMVVAAFPVVEKSSCVRNMKIDIVRELVTKTLNDNVYNDDKYRGPKTWVAG